MTNEEELKIEKLQSEGYGYKKIALMLDLPVNTVKSFLRRHPVNQPISTAVPMQGCLNCGSPLVQRPGKKGKKFCSDRCRMAWRNAHPERVNRKAFYGVTCAHCGREFQAYGNRSRKYCSRLCFDQARSKGGQDNE